MNPAECLSECEHLATEFRTMATRSVLPAWLLSEAADIVVGKSVATLLAYELGPTGEDAAANQAAIARLHGIGAEVQALLAKPSQN